MSKLDFLALVPSASEFFHLSAGGFPLGFTSRAALLLGLFFEAYSRE
jgi:hypothetical protein